MKKQYKQYLAFAIGLLIHLSVQGQSYDPSGPTTNLCPGVTYRYYSPTTAINGGSCAQNGWGCTGCFNPDKQDVSVIAVGEDYRGVFADVKWANSSSGTIANFCGSLSVSIISIEQPTISIVQPATSPATQLSLCGSGSVTFQANVLSTANITGYVWDVEGTGITSATGIINTTSNQLTVTYANWTASSSFSATVAAGSKESCGYNTRVTPLQDVIFDGKVIDKKIPRSAWTNVIHGNIDNLLIPYNFSPTTVCGNPTMQVTNQPSGSSISWSSSNTSALNFTNTSTGDATRVNNYTGAVTVTATLSTACGSNSESKNIWIGLPTLMGLTDNGNSVLPSTVCAGNTDLFQTYLDANYPQDVYYNVGWSGTNVTISSYGAPTSSVYYSGTIGSTASVTATITNACGQWEGNETWIGQIVDCGGGGNQNSTIYPNPSDKFITIKTQSFSKSESTVSISIVNEQDQTMYQNTVTGGTEVNVQVNDWQKGTYYLKMSDGKKDKSERLVINH